MITTAFFFSVDVVLTSKMQLQYCRKICLFLETSKILNVIINLSLYKRCHVTFPDPELSYLCFCTDPWCFKFEITSAHNATLWVFPCFFFFPLVINSKVKQDKSLLYVGNIRINSVHWLLGVFFFLWHQHKLCSLTDFILIVQRFSIICFSQNYPIFSLPIFFLALNLFFAAESIWYILIT